MKVIIVQMNSLTSKIPTARYFRCVGIFGRYSVFLGICYIDVGIGIRKYRGICSVSVLPTQAWTSDPQFF